MGMQSSIRLEKWFQIFDSRLNIKDIPLLCLYMEAIRLRCFMPTRYVQNGEYPSHTRTYNVDDLYPICSKGPIGSMLALYASTVHVATLKCYLHTCNYSIDRSMEVIWKKILLSVSAPLKKTNLNNVIHGGTGSTSGHNFYMGTQNGSKLEFWWWELLIHASEFKLRCIEFYICIGKPYTYICNDLHLHWDILQCLYRKP